MKTGFRQSMAWLHTWSGLLVGWVLFLIFLTGTFGYLNHEVGRWMTPERPMVKEALPAKDLLPLAVARLSEKGASADTWRIRFPGARMRDHLEVQWAKHPKEGAKRRRNRGTREILNQTTGLPIEQVEARKTGGGYFLYRLHYRLHYMPRLTAYWLVGICSMFMLVAIIGGVIIHKKIFKDFFTFRPAKGQRSWLDGHNVLSVTALPFHFMITFSGLVFLMFTYIPLGPELIYGEGNRTEFFDELYGKDEKISPLPKDVKMAAILPMFVKAEEKWGQDNVSMITVNNRGTQNAKVTFYQRDADEIVDNSMEFNGASGAMIARTPTKGAEETQSVLTSLHEGLFAGPLLRLLYIVSGLAGTGMIGTGLLLWSTKRKQKLLKSGTPHLGIMIVDRLNLGTIIGLPIAIAAYFWANRLIPAAFDGRQAWEAHALFITWGAMMIYPIWRPLDRAWFEMLCFASAACGLLPLLNFITTDRHLGITIPYGDWVLAGFDLSMFFIAFCFALTAKKAYKKISNPEKKKKLIKEVSSETVTSPTVISN